jgi:outer membrane murein-binding lipoprotein Lpp
MDDQFNGQNQYSGTPPPSHSTPPQHHQSNDFAQPSRPHPVVGPKKRKMMRFLMWILVIILIAGAGYGGYMYEHHKATNVELSQSSQITTLQSQQANLEKELDAAKASSAKAAASSTTQTNQNLVKFTALGVEVTTPNALKTLTISSATTKGTATSVSVSSPTVATAIPQCATDAFGTLTKTTGTYPTTGVAASTWHQQFTGFYLTLTPTSTSCAPPSTTQANLNILTGQLAVFEASLPSAAVISN